MVVGVERLLLSGGGYLAIESEKVEISGDDFEFLWSSQSQPFCLKSPRPPRLRVILQPQAAREMRDKGVDVSDAHGDQSGIPPGCRIESTGSGGAGDARPPATFCHPAGMERQGTKQ